MSQGTECIDKKEGIKWLRKAAEQGNLGAQINLGATYSTRQDIEPDRIEACRWCRMAAEQGSSSPKEKIKDCKISIPNHKKIVNLKYLFS